MLNYQKDKIVWAIRPRSDDEESMHLDDTSLITSKTIDFLNGKETIECEIENASTSKVSTIERAEGKELSASE